MKKSAYRRRGITYIDACIKTADAASVDTSITDIATPAESMASLNATSVKDAPSIPRGDMSHVLRVEDSLYGDLLRRLSERTSTAYTGARESVSNLIKAPYDETETV